MTRSRLIALATTFALLALHPPGAHAGQVRVKVGGIELSFIPGSISLNAGDHVTWVWAGGTHTVTSGIDGDPDAGVLFGSPLMGFSGINASAFSWKAGLPGIVPYHCQPHAAFGMVGELDVQPSGVPVASFRITEVLYNEASGRDLIQITNLGSDVGDLGRYRVVNTSRPAVSLAIASLSVPVGGRVTIHTNQTGTNTATDLYASSIGDLPATGSVALYVPSTVSGTSLADATQIIDFVQWGGASQPNSATAIAAGVWPTNDFLPAVQSGYDIVFCGSATQYGPAGWSVALPNFGSAPACTTPTRSSTWGRIKVLYR